MKVATGLDRIAKEERSVVKLIKGRRLGLLAHPASVDAGFQHARKVIQHAGGSIEALFGPEHGFAGQAQDMKAVPSGSDEQSETSIYSLYGESEDQLQPRPEWLSGLDAVVIDLQDVGSRYYTFVWTAALMLRTAATSGVQTIVLDRPNPLGGNLVEGAVQRKGYRSFVGLYDVSIRHGMTIGEILTMVRRVEEMDTTCLEIIPMKGWQREMRFEDTGLPWISPSPNMPTLQTTQVYPGGCLLEGTNLSEGRGTTLPFEIWGAPFIDGFRLADTLASEGAVLRPLTYVPTFHKYAGHLCGGVQVHITDVVRFRPYSFYLKTLARVRQLYGPLFKWRTEAYEFVNDRPAIDLLTGGPEFRTAVDNNSDLDDVLAQEDKGARDFIQSRKQDLLY